MAMARGSGVSLLRMMERLMVSGDGGGRGDPYMPGGVDGGCKGKASCRVACPMGADRQCIMSAALDMAAQGGGKMVCLFL